MNTLENRRVLVVEDDPDVAQLVAFHLERDGYRVKINPTGQKFISDVSDFDPALVVLDLMLPAANGFELLRSLRREPRLAKVPVIVLTARTSESDRVEGLDIGADDYVTKPFSARELLARVRARLRTGAVPQVETLSAGELMLDLRAHSGTLRGAPLELSDTEFRILAFLMKEPGKAFTRRAIIDAIWSPRHFITERTVDVYILRLRSKIEADPENPKYLVSVRRVGYRFGPLPGVV